jgi:hypothetical protein
MGERFTSETFFRPDEQGRERLAIPAALFNRCRLMLTRYESEHVFVPIRSMQYQAVIDRGEIIFVDNHGGYAVRDGHGGRLIVLAWLFSQDVGRNSLNEPVPIDLVSYSVESRAIHRRVMSEFPRALGRLEEKLRESHCEPRRKVILPFQTKHG